MRLLFSLAFTAICAHATPDTLRYEKMSLVTLVAEVLEAPADAAESDGFAASVDAAFRAGETSDTAFARALTIQKRYPYCVSVTMSPDAPRWGICIFRFNRDGEEVTGKYELWIYLSTEDGLIKDVSWVQSAWDL